MAGRAALWCLCIAAALAGRGAAATVQSLGSGLLCKRLDRHAPGLVEGELALYNPSALRHPEHGWVVFFRHDLCHPGYSPVCPVYTTTPYAGNWGNLALPDHSLTAQSARPVRLSEATLAKLDALNATRVHLGDLRPFLWKNEIYASHFVFGEGIAPPYVVQGLLKMNVERDELDLLHIWTRLGPKDLGTREEKNWAFLSSDEDRISVIYSLVPATVVARLTLDDLAGSLQVNRRLRDSELARVLEGTSLNMSRSVHNSGHPVAWAGPDGASSELLALVHQRFFGPQFEYSYLYAHWALRIDPVTWTVTHISRGPILQWSDYRVRGFKFYAVVVGSYHVLKAETTGRPHDTLRVYFGEGDKYSCWEDYDPGRIQWLKLGEAAFEEADSF